MLIIELVGYGYWQSNIGCSISDKVNGKVLIVVFGRKVRLVLVRRNYLNIDFAASLEELIDCLKVNLEVIETAVFCHNYLTKQVLFNGKHVLIEKAMTFTIKKAKELI